MDDRLPMKWQQLFGVLEWVRQQVPLTPMSQDLQDFWQFILRFKEQYEKLAQHGADLDFVTHVLYVLMGFSSKRSHVAMSEWRPRKEHRQVLRQASKAMPDLECLERTVAHEGFEELSDELQTAVRSELSVIRMYCDSLARGMAEQFQRLEATDPLVLLLAQAQPTYRERGRPSAAVPTLFMVLLTDHLQERTRHRCYREIGLVTYHLFAGSISERIITDPKALGVGVRDRCKKFRKTHDVAALRRALLATEKPFVLRSHERSCASDPGVAPYVV